MTSYATSNVLTCGKKNMPGSMRNYSKKNASAFWKIFHFPQDVNTTIVYCFALHVA